MIQFINFQKQYGDYKVMDIAQAQIEAGIYWLKGINGSGKSTLLRCLAGLIPFEGAIHINAINIRKSKRLHRQLVNYGEAEPVYPPFLNGSELIHFYAAAKGGNKSECMQYAEQLQLHHALQKQTGSYSSGMLKKLSLILAFTGNPKWILLDEPLITLDAEAVATMLQIIEQAYNRGISFLLTSHQDVAFPDHTLPLQTLYIKDKTVTAIP
ncbi:ABC transporter ATP-binding protein [Ilyomonas limi]|uniref:ABC transporter ATP-binding protein n=1 Tax=Ilyomonas limi TaxID=2575867 RepID=A0A4U3LCI9_9BACT|nr:ABC transporter ATP-binding protein [Ilyomonas limi]TKK71597.1 ABC transporter ATP-binding protein [Ilyomonas limi]